MNNKKQETKKLVSSHLLEIVLAVLLFISLGAMMGSMAYYLSMSNSIPLINQVAVSTDKIEYKKGEIIDIRIINGISKAIYLNSCNPSIERKNNENWTTVYREDCPIETICDSSMFILGKCYERENLHRKINIRSINHFIIKAAEAGIFRIKIDYNNNCIFPTQRAKFLGASEPISCSGENIVYSDEFIVR